MSVLRADLHAALHAPVGAADHLHFGAVIGEAVLHLDAERAADRIEAEHRIVGKQRNPIDGFFRDEIPVDHVTPGFVDAHAVLIDRDTLRRSLHGRCLESAVVEVALEWIAGLVAERNTGQSAIYRIEEVGRIVVVEIS